MQENYTNPQELRSYEDNVNAYRDILNAIKTAEKKKFAEGKAEGRAEGRAEGKAEGRVEGRAEVRAEIARRLLEMGMSIGDIVNVTGLSQEEISNLKR